MDAQRPILQITLTADGVERVQGLIAADPDAQVVYTLYRNVLPQIKALDKAARRVSDGPQNAGDR